MSEFTDAVDGAVHTLREAGGTVVEVRIEPSRLKDFYSDAWLPTWVISTDIYADPDVCAYEVVVDELD